MKSFDFKISVIPTNRCYGLRCNLYPCNYHPRPNGYIYGSAIDNSFQEVWESRNRCSVKSGIPSICPNVCDPYKNRANIFLNKVHDINENMGFEQLVKYRNELLHKV